ncbi:MAG TPA: multicopper oxidase domain-containing protein [Chloroflexota bacterium]|jgi:FtsP/CotA-like multicopper oxidase with cupredoxin domain|nr:multicopper oxidase domain-containing protein [Chloroflexota bacterium]
MPSKTLARLASAVAPVGAAAVLLLGGSGVPVRAQTAATSGMVCTTNASNTFTMTAQPGYVAMPDGNTVYMWSFAAGNQAFQLPGPTLCVNQGATVTIVLNNTLTEDVSLVFPGQESVTANGAPAQPQFDTAGNVTSLAPVAPKTNGSMTYSFVASSPGTYLYLSGSDPTKQVQMGLYGSLVVRPTQGFDFAYNRADSRFNPANEYLMLFSEVDPILHHAVELGQAYDINTYQPRYWLINGRSFPDTISDNNSPWLPSQPYGALVHIHPTTVSNPLPALVRYLNVGAYNHPFHPHGNHGRIIGRDGRALESSSHEDLSYEKFLVLLGSGQTTDALYTWTDVDAFSPTTNPIPVPQPQQQNLTYKDNATWYSGSPYLGFKGDLPVGVTSYNECGEYYHVWHSHALNEAANWDAGFGGMFTLERVDPPTPNTCP